MRLYSAPGFAPAPAVKPAKALAKLPLDVRDTGFVGLLGTTLGVDGAAVAAAGAVAAAVAPPAAAVDGAPNDTVRATDGRGTAPETAAAGAAATAAANAGSALPAPKLFVRDATALLLLGLLVRELGVFDSALFRPLE